MRWRPTGSIRAGATRRRRSGAAATRAPQRSTSAAADGTDALPQLRRVIHSACLTPPPAEEPERRPLPAGLGLDWHYRLPFDPPFLVPDCRTRRLMVAADDDAARDRPRRREEGAAVADHRRAQLDVDARHPRRSMARRPGRVHRPVDAAADAREVHDLHARTGGRGRRLGRGADIAGIVSVLLDSTSSRRSPPNALLRVFRRGKDLEHMIRDRSWRDMWAIVEDMRKKGARSSRSYSSPATCITATA